MEKSCGLQQLGVNTLLQLLQVGGRGAKISMPNVRAKGLRLLNLWVDREVVKAFQRLARRRGTNCSDLLRTSIEEMLQKDERKIKKDFGNDRQKENPDKHRPAARGHRTDKAAG